MPWWCSPAAARTHCLPLSLARSLAPPPTATTRPLYNQVLSARELADMVLVRASRTRNGADAYFMAKTLFEPEGGDWLLKSLERETFPITINFIDSEGCTFVQVGPGSRVNSWFSFGVFC